MGEEPEQVVVAEVTTANATSPESSTPRIAVCVPTRNRAWLLPRLVAALEQQTVARNRFEVVVADDGSSDDTWAVLSDLAARSKVRLHTVRNATSGGPGAGRNTAWRRTAAPLIAFVDDDCVPAPEWLAAHLAALEHADISQGRVEADPAQAGHAGPFSRTIGVAEENGLYETCNIAYRREWLERLEGFDIRFHRSGEDADLAWRAKELGASTVFVPDALVYHDVNPSSWRRAMRDTLRWTGVVDLVERHPQLRSRFGPGPTFRAAHRPALLAAAAFAFVAWAASTRRWAWAGLGLLGSVPYADLRLRRLPIVVPRRKRLGLLLPALAVDVAEVVVIRAWRVRARARSIGGRPSAPRARASV